MFLEAPQSSVAPAVIDHFGTTVPSSTAPTPYALVIPSLRRRYHIRGAPPVTKYFDPNVPPLNLSTAPIPYPLLTLPPSVLLS